MFSTGMPILYPFAAVFFFLTYWFYKYLLINYYAKTTKFNEELPQFSTGLIKVGLIFHVLCGGVMVTNSDIMPPEQQFQVDNYLDEFENDSHQAFTARFFKNSHGYYYFTFIVMIIVFLILKNTVFRLVLGVTSQLWECTLSPPRFP